jgi:hypothetical protein
MTNKTLSLVVLLMITSTFSFSMMSTYAADISAEDIQASQRQALESIEKAKNIAAQAELKQDASKYRIEIPTSPVDQITIKAQKAANQTSATSTATAVGVISQCELVTYNIEIQVTKFNEGKNPRIQKYQIVSDKLTDLIQRLKAEKIDTKSLEATQTVLDSKIKKYTSVQDNYSSSITKTKTSTCTKPENEFKSSLQESQNSLKTVKESGKDLQDYVQKTVRPEVQKIRDQIKK